MIEAKGMCLIYPNGTTALKNIDIKIGPGEVVYITGPSGSGKTSLLKLCMGIEYPTSGTLKVLGYNMVRKQSDRLRRMRMLLGPVFQEFRLIKGRTALENVMMGMRFLDVTPSQLKKRACDALVKVGLEHKVLAMVENLSWGECQRVAIARAVARKPALILADEPTGNLDVDNAVKILELLTSFKDSNTSVIITTHATHLIVNAESARHIRIENGIMTMDSTGGA